MVAAAPTAATAVSSAPPDFARRPARLPGQLWSTGWLVARAAPTWLARAIASSRCSREGRAPGTGVIRNRPWNRPPLSTSSSMSVSGKPSASTSRASWSQGDRTVVQHPRGPAEPGDAVLEAARPQRKQRSELAGDLFDQGRRGAAGRHRLRGAVDSVEVTGAPAGIHVLAAPPDGDLGDRDPDHEQQHGGLDVGPVGDAEPLVGLGEENYGNRNASHGQRRGDFSDSATSRSSAGRRGRRPASCRGCESLPPRRR